MGRGFNRKIDLTTDRSHPSEPPSLPGRTVYTEIIVFKKPLYLSDTVTSVESPYTETKYPMAFKRL